MGMKRGCQFQTNLYNRLIQHYSPTSSYIIPRYDSNSTEIVVNGFPLPLHLSSGQELRLWYDEDFLNKTGADNVGESCAVVFAKHL